MKRLLFTFCLFTVFSSSAQYDLGKSKNEIHSSLKDYVVFFAGKDSALMAQPKNDERFAKVFYFSHQKDSCTSEVLVFNDRSYQMTYLKVLDELWIYVEDNLWKTNFKGKTIHARLFYLKTYEVDAVSFTIVSEF